MELFHDNYFFLVDEEDNFHCADVCLSTGCNSERYSVKLDKFDPSRNLIQVIPRLKHTDQILSEELGCVIFGIKQGNEKTNRKAVLWHCVLEET